MYSVSAGRILTPTQPVGSRRPQRESNPGPSHQESHILLTELPQGAINRRTVLEKQINKQKKNPTAFVLKTDLFKQNSYFVNVCS